LVFGFCASVSSVLAGAEFTLTKDGRAACVIVTAASPTANAKFAADELQKYVEKISGAKLEIRTDAETLPDGPRVLVGKSKLTEAISGLKIPDGRTADLREEGYVVYCKGDALVAAGNDMDYYYGTRYAVDDLLKRFGVRWFMPGAYGEYVPKAATLQMPTLFVTETPDFPVRSFWMCGGQDLVQDTNLWMIRNRMNPSSPQWFGIPIDGTLAGYLPKDKINEHPEWFALQPDGSRSPTMNCMTDELRRTDPKYAGQPRLLDEIMKKVGENVKNGNHSFAFSPDDGGPGCCCSSCRKMSIRFQDGWQIPSPFGQPDEPGDPIPFYLSGQEYFYFIQGLLEATASQYPGQLIATNGYANRYVPLEPMPGFNRHKNLTIMYADINACTIHRFNDPKCWQQHEEYDVLKRWCQLSDKVWLYGYNYTMLVSKDTLSPMERRIATNIPMIKDAGAIGFHDQEWIDLSQLGLPTYVARMALEWNTKVSVDGVLDDFYSKWFGPASAPIKDYYEALEMAFDNTPYHAHEDCILQDVYTPTLMARLADDIAKAETVVRTDADKLHVRVERMQFDHLRFYVDSIQAKNELRFRESARLVEQMVKIKTDMNKITPYYGRPPSPYGMDWEIWRMKRLAAKSILAPLPINAAFRSDKYDRGRTRRYMEADFDDSKWQTCRTTSGWQNQGLREDDDSLPLMTRDGHCYKGFAWYRFVVDVPKVEEGKHVRLTVPAITNQAWVWVNGQFAGRNNYQSGWSRPQEMDIEVTSCLKPGKNVIAIRVWCLEDYFGANGIYERGFLYTK
jgi:hypothetical protein